MKLHYAGDKPEWEAYPVAEHNFWQRYAARTRGIATPGNVFSVLGAVLVLWGLWMLTDHHYWVGFWLVGAGRFCDIVDGTVANATRTKGPLGEAIDVTIDKIAAFAALVAFIIAGIAPWWVIAVLALQNIITASVGYAGHRRGHQIHTVAAGKLGGATEWAGFGSFVLAAAFGHGSTGAHVWTVAAYIFCTVALSLNIYAIGLYLRVLRSQK